MSVTVHNATFVGSYTDYKKCVQSALKEYAFIGRSNVGKSSLLNMLCGKKGLAKVSSSPGKTKLINLFNLDDKIMLADLPGYGYARVSKTEKASWQKFIMDYLLHRDRLHCLLVLIDSRLEPQKIDLEFMSWLGMKGIPFVIVFTKADKLSKHELGGNISHYKNELLKYWEELPQSFITSSNEKTGKEELLEFIFTS